MKWSRQRWAFRLLRRDTILNAMACAAFLVIPFALFVPVCAKPVRHHEIDSERAYRFSLERLAWSFWSYRNEWGSFPYDPQGPAYALYRLVEATEDEEQYYYWTQYEGLFTCDVRSKRAVKRHVSYWNPEPAAIDDVPRVIAERRKALPSGETAVFFVDSLCTAYQVNCHPGNIARHVTFLGFQIAEVARMGRLVWESEASVPTGKSVEAD